MSAASATSAPAASTSTTTCGASCFGLALVVDEAALLIELKDVYWDTAGGVSVAIALILIGLVGSVLVLTRVRGVDEDEP